MSERKLFSNICTYLKGVLDGIICVRFFPWTGFLRNLGVILNCFKIHIDIRNFLFIKLTAINECSVVDTARTGDKALSATSIDSMTQAIN